MTENRKLTINIIERKLYNILLFLTNEKFSESEMESDGQPASFNESNAAFTYISYIFQVMTNRDSY